MLVGLTMCMALSAAALTLTLMRANPFRPLPLSAWLAGFMHEATSLDGSCERFMWGTVQRASPEAASRCGTWQSAGGAARASVVPRSCT